VKSLLKVDLVESEGKHILYFSGAIDEDSNFDNIDLQNLSEVTFDLEGIQLINSCGIREWIKFQDQLSKTIFITYKNCPQIIVEQMNIIKGFVKDCGTIESFYAPYYDEESDTEVKILITPSEVIEGKAPLKKNENAKDLEFDDIEAQYFSFLKNI